MGLLEANVQSRVAQTPYQSNGYRLVMYRYELMQLESMHRRIDQAADAEVSQVSRPVHVGA